MDRAPPDRVSVADRILAPVVSDPGRAYSGLPVPRTGIRPMTIAIEVDNLQKTFKGKRVVRALDGVSLAVPEGTVFGLLGPNGSGKTTVVRILTTILRADGGSARVLGNDVQKKAALVRTLIGLAGQYAAVDENLTGRENLQMVGNLNHLPRTFVATRAVELLDQFNLTDAGDRPLKTYSGGMRRRLDLAAALVARPTVLFLDEPTTGLDPQSRNDLWEVIEGLVGGGTTVLLTTQYLEEADRLASQLAVIDHGRVIAEGTPESMKADLGATVLEVGLPTIEDAQRTTAILDALGPHSSLVSGTLVEVTVENGPQAAMIALRALDAEGISPQTFNLREPSLDDVFLSLTGHRTEAEEADGTEDENLTPRQQRRMKRLEQLEEALPIATGELA
jgi:ABC-2 type transport system ATP-binding protein